MTRAEIIWLKKEYNVEFINQLPIHIQHEINKWWSEEHLLWIKENQKVLSSTAKKNPHFKSGDIVV